MEEEISFLCKTQYNNAIQEVQRNAKKNDESNQSECIDQLIVYDDPNGNSNNSIVTESALSAYCDLYMYYFDSLKKECILMIRSCE